MGWLFGDSFDHYTDLLTKYDAVGTHQAIGLGTGRFGTNGCRFTGAGGYIGKTVSPTAPYNAFVTLACSLQRTTSGRFGFLNLWAGTRGHLVLARQDDGSLTAHRQTGTEGPLESSGPIIATTAANVWPVGSYASIELAVVVHATAGGVFIRVNGEALLSLTGLATANPNATGWTGWYVGLEHSIGTLDIDDLMLYSDQNVGDGVAAFLGDLTGECVVPSSAFAEEWTRNSGPTNWSTVDEIPPDNDTTYIETGVIGLSDYYRMQRLTRVSQGIRAVQIAMTARKTGSPPRTVAGVIYDAQGLTYESPPLPLSVGYRVAVAPRPLASYGGYWTMDQINALAVGIKLVG
jgi:hypothetical protein